MRIRKANLKDLKQLIEIKKNNFQLNDFKVDLEKYYTCLIQDGIVIIAEEKGKLIGVVAGEKELQFSHSYIEDGYVAEKYRKRGLGRKLLSVYEEECKKNNIIFISAHVMEENPGALKAMQKAGFKKGKKYFLMEKEID